jgi:hypothetical protein
MNTTQTAKQALQTTTPNGTAKTMVTGWSIQPTMRVTTLTDNGTLTARITEVHAEVDGPMGARRIVATFDTGQTLHFLTAHAFDVHEGRTLARHLF